VRALVPQPTVRRVASRALGEEARDTRILRVESLDFNATNPTTVSVDRVHLVSVQRGRPTPWTAVVKRLTGSAMHAGTSLGYWNHWRREQFVYDSGLLDMLPASIRAPRFYGTFSGGKPRTLSLWLEDVHEHTRNWRATDFQSNARHLGAMAGAWAGKPFSRHRFLANNWLTQLVSMAQPFVGDLLADEVWNHPWAKQAFSIPVKVRARQLLLYEAPRMLTRLARLPATLCHFDPHRANSFLESGPRTVLLDWSFLGAGPVGADLGAALFGNAFSLEIAPRSLDAVSAKFPSEYLAGLRSVGVRASRQDIEFAMNAVAVIRTAQFLPFALQASREAGFGEQATGFLARVAKRPVEFGRAVAWLFDRVNLIT
jgi:hypothetical protein